MANHCFNYIVIKGDPIEVEELTDRITAYMNTSEHSGYFSNTYYTMFKTMQSTPENTEGFDVSIEYGSRWFDPVSWEMDSDSILLLQGDSAWGPVLQLSEKLALDYDLEITHEFSEPGMNFAGIYKYDASGCIEQEDMTYDEYEYQDDKHEYINRVIDHADSYDSYKEFLESYDETFKIILTKYNDEETVQEIKKEAEEYFKSLE